MLLFSGRGEPKYDIVPQTTSETPAHARSSHGLRGRRTNNAKSSGQQRDSDSQGSSGSLQGVSIGNGKSEYNLLIENLVMLPRCFRGVKKISRARLIAYRASAEFLTFHRCSLVQIENNCWPVGLFFRHLRMFVKSSLPSEAAFTKRISSEVENG